MAAKSSCRCELSTERSNQIVSNGMKRPQVLEFLLNKGASFSRLLCAVLFLQFLLYHLAYFFNVVADASNDVQ